MSEDEILDHIKRYADRSHGAQLRKYTAERYIVHPVRVMEIVRDYYTETPVLAAALLHDVLEDTPVTANDMEIELLRVMDPAEVKTTLQIVIELTDIFVKKQYPRLSRKVRKEKEALRLSSVSAAAQTVKYADIIDNVRDIVEQDADFARVFVKEARQILTLTKAGDPHLRTKALYMVDEFLGSLETPVETTSGR